MKGRRHMVFHKYKHWLLLFTLTCALALTAGCGEEEDGTSQTEVQETAESSEEETEEESSTGGSGEVYGPAYQKDDSTSDKESSETDADSGTESDEAASSADTDSSEGISENEGTLSAPADEGSSGSSIFGSSDDTSGSSEEADAEMQALLSTLSFPASNGSWSVYICDLAQQTDGMYSDHQMQAASLIKLFIMGAVYENYSSITAAYGQSSVDSNLYSMITVSDNDAANTLVSCLGSGDSTAGMQAVNSYCAANGYYNTHMGRLLLASNAVDDNYTSVGDCGSFLKKIYQGNASGDSICQAEFSLLAAQTRRNKIPAQLPSGVSVANKTGELDTVENDAGIIYNTQHDLILVFMSENLTNVGDAQNTIASMSLQIYSYYNQQS